MVFLKRKKRVTKQNDFEEDTDIPELEPETEVVQATSSSKTTKNEQEQPKKEVPAYIQEYLDKYNGVFMPESAGNPAHLNCLLFAIQDRLKELTEAVVDLGNKLDYPQIENEEEPKTPQTKQQQTNNRRIG